DQKKIGTVGKARRRGRGRGGTLLLFLWRERRLPLYGEQRARLRVEQRLHEILRDEPLVKPRRDAIILRPLVGIERKSEPRRLGLHLHLMRLREFPRLLNEGREIEIRVGTGRGHFRRAQ